jgi:lysylphosphatidylglycerol synthetase-like protein (DUF2156 family)
VWQYLQADRFGVRSQHTPRARARVVRKREPAGASLVTPPLTAAVAATLGSESYVDHAAGSLALSARNQRFVIVGAPGFIAYREQGRHWVVFGGVHAPEAARAVLLDAFLSHAATRLRPVVFVQIRPAQIALFRARGFTVFTPFLVQSDEPQGASPMLAKILRLLARYGRFIYPVVSRAEDKSKWPPEASEPEFVAARPLSLRAIIDLLVLARSL